MSNLSRRDFIGKTALIAAGIFNSTILCSDKLWGGEDGTSSPALLVPPYLGKPTGNTISINLVAGEKPLVCYIRYQKLDGQSREKWELTPVFKIEPLTPKEILLDRLVADASYRYQIVAKLADLERIVSGESFRTQKKKTKSFSFGIFSDSHITPFDGERKEILTRISASILSKRPDFALMLGDNIQTFTSHGGPMTEAQFGPVLYANLRYAMGTLPSAIPLFNVIGNWEGENGWHTEKERGWARQARRSYIPTPDPRTYPEGGGKYGEYYGFRWGDVQFLVLTVTGYTQKNHAMYSLIGQADDWTLGEEQKTWLHDQLKESTAKWKLVFIHHTVSGNAGDDINSRYGRGGGRAAKVGEQKLIHEWMKKYQAQALFYGHDHVFTDVPVDGIHYICVGSAGAPWKFDQSITGYEKYWTPFGFTYVDVTDSHLTVSFQNQDGSLLHSFDIR